MLSLSTSRWYLFFLKRLVISLMTDSRPLSPEEDRKRSFIDRLELNSRREWTCTLPEWLMRGKVKRVFARVIFIANHCRNKG